MKTQEIAAIFTEQSGREMLLTLARTPDDKLDWQPEPPARSTMDIVRECAVHTDEWAQLLELGVWPEHFKTRVGSIVSRQEAVDEMSAAIRRLVDVIRAFPDESLGKALRVPWTEAPMGVWLSYSGSHNQYHIGQLNYIQTLYGDTAMDF